MHRLAGRRDGAEVGDVAEEDGRRRVLLRMRGASDAQVARDGARQHGAEDCLGAPAFALEVGGARREDGDHAADGTRRGDGVVGEEGDDGEVEEEEQGEEGEGEEGGVEGGRGGRGSRGAGGVDGARDGVDEGGEHGAVVVDDALPVEEARRGCGTGRGGHEALLGASACQQARVGRVVALVDGAERWHGGEGAKQRRVLEQEVGAQVKVLARREAAVGEAPLAVDVCPFARLLGAGEPVESVRVAGQPLVLPVGARRRVRAHDGDDAVDDARVEALLLRDGRLPFAGVEPVSGQ